MLLHRPFEEEYETESPLATGMKSGCQTSSVRDREAAAYFGRSYSAAIATLEPISFC